MTEDEDNLTIEDVVSVCKNASNETIEIKRTNPFNSKTSDFLEKYELSFDDIVWIVKRIKSCDYHSGPLPDYNPNNKHPLWVFIKDILIKNVRIYIYIKIKIIDHRRKIIVYSLHEEGIHNDKK